MSLEPLPETRDALETMGRSSDRGLAAALTRQSRLVEDIVPNLVGLSLALVQEGLTSTLAASDGRLALLDAIQYAVGGPCVDAAMEDRTVLGGNSDGGLLGEERRVEFAPASAAHGS